MEPDHRPRTPSDRRRTRLTATAIVILLCGTFAAAWYGVSKDASQRDVALPEAQNAQTTSNGHRTPYAPPSNAGFTGSAACAECHAEIVELYTGTHPMGRSLRRVADDFAADESPCTAAVVPGEQRVLTVECQDGLIVHHEKMFDGDGREIYDLALPMDYVVGSGRRAKAYLLQAEQVLFMSPLNWYAQGSQWALAPNFRPDDVRRFDRRVTSACLGCHAGRVEVAERGVDAFAEPMFHELSIGCERCHGPGADHIAFHGGTHAAGERGVDASDAVAAAPHAPEHDPIVNPTDLDYERQESVCYQCHLSGAARVLRSGRSHLDFRPGMRLIDVWAVLDQGADVTSDGRTRSINHVQQMRDSLCFRESGQQLGCISCHDPHQVPAAEVRGEYYRQRCLQCHSENACGLPLVERATEENSCIACHMPRRDSSNMTHVVQTDHRIRRDPRPLMDAEPETGSLTLFDQMEAALSPAERDRAFALGAFIHLSRKGLPIGANIARFLEAVVQEFPEDATVLLTRGNVALENGHPGVAREAFERAYALPGEREAALSGLLRIAYESADWSRTVSHAEALLKINPRDSRVYAMYGDALANLGQHEAAVAAVQRAAALNPGLIPLHEWLAEHYGRLGRDADRLKEEALIRRLRTSRIPEDLKSR